MVGDTLRRERERQKLSIKDIEKATSIRALYIEAIENSENDKLPGEVYTKGFIKNYANFLNLDGESLVREYREEISPMPAVADKKSDGDGAVEQSTEAQKAAPAPRATRAQQSSDDGNRKSMMAIAAVLVCAIVGGLMYYFSSANGGEVATAPIEQTKAVEQQAATPEPQQPASTNVATSVASAAPSTDGVNLEAKFSDRCWTKVTVDGVVAYEGTAEQGQSLSWKANDRIDVTAGNAGAIEFVENGVNLGIAGAVGDVIDKTFVKK